MSMPMPSCSSGCSSQGSSRGSNSSSRRKSRRGYSGLPGGIRLPLFFFCSAGILPQPSLCEPCAKRPKDDNVLQFTSEKCDCCHDLNEFVMEHENVYVLFYANKGRLNIDINAKFEEMAREWKWSRVHFGRIDTDKDREMAKKWVEPHMVPTNVMFKNGKPVTVKPKDFETIRDKYGGSPEGQKWLVSKYMGNDVDASNLHYATPLTSAKRKNKLLKEEVAILGYFKREGELAHKVFLEAIWKLGQDRKDKALGAAVGSITMQSIIKKDKAHVPSIVVYLDGQPVEDEGVFKTEKWTVKSVMTFVKQFLPMGDDDGPTADEL